MSPGRSKLFKVIVRRTSFKPETGAGPYFSLMDFWYGISASNTRPSTHRSHELIEHYEFFAIRVRGTDLPPRRHRETGPTDGVTCIREIPTPISIKCGQSGDDQRCQTSAKRQTTTLPTVTALIAT